MIRVALSFLLGVLIFQISRTLPSNLFLVGIPLVVLAYFYYPRGLLVYVAIFAYLWTLLFASAKLNPRLDPQLEGQDIAINGSIVEVTKQSAQYARLVFAVDEAIFQDSDVELPQKLVLSWYYQPDHSFSANQQCNLMVRLKRHWRFANLGSIDREKQMFLRGIGARGYVRSGQCEYVTDNLSQEEKNIRATLIGNFSELNARLKYFGLMQALTFGVREDMDQSQWDVLRATGTTHLLAISGLHLSAICIVVFIFSCRLARLSAYLCERIPAQSIAAIIAMLATILYAYLAGFSIPTQRALIMVFVALFAILLRRPVVQFPLLATALLLVLLWNPLVVLTASFWMSFLAVLFIFIILKSGVGSNKLIIVLRIQFYLAAALLPVSMLIFTHGSLIAPVVNLVAIPYVSFLLLPALLFSQLLFQIGFDASHYLFTLIDQLFDGLWWWLTICAEFPFASIRYQPTMFGVIAYEFGLLMLIQAKGLPARYLATVFMAALFFVVKDPVGDDQLRITILDVGQGLAVVVETSNHTLVYDAGPKYLSGFSTGDAVVLPYLIARNVNKVDIAIVSHNDNDHAGGMHSLSEEAMFETLLISNQKSLYQGSSIAYCRDGDEWWWDGVHFLILHPPRNWQSNKNNRSCVLQIIHPAGTILLAGDIEASSEQRLVSQFGDKLRSDLLIAPHHGSYSSSSRRFVASVRPQTAVFSVGYRNRYGFPHAKIMRRYQSIGAELADTSREGAVTFIFDTQEGIHKEAGFRSQSARYWNSTREDS